MKKLPDFSYEKKYWNGGFTVIGIDEVGRGAFAGPVGVGGVVFSSGLSKSKIEYLLSLGINDSKKLTPKKRESLSVIIKKECVDYAISFIDVTTINEIGIGRATLLGMEEVAKSLSKKIKNPYLLIDAYKIPGIDNQKGIIYGDSLSVSIAAASILAKVERDSLMVELGLEFPDYGFEKHKGYGTKFHRDAIQKHGQTKHHRIDFCHGTTSK